jgi:hypothetical protein
MDTGRKLTTSDIAAAADHSGGDTVPERERLERTDAEVREHGLAADAPTPLFAGDELTGYRTRWSAIQTGFVDEPRKAVEEADALVAELMKRLAEVFADERRKLESQWERSDQVSTEDLRIAMRRYRSFFERLLNI